MDIQHLDEHELIELGRHLLYDHRDTLNSFEAAALVCVHHLYNSLCSADGNPAFSLLRLFRVTQYDDLPHDLQKLVSPGAPGYLTLFATVGAEKAWNNRHTSKHHQAIPVGESMSPMFQGVFRALGLHWDGKTAFHIPAAEATQMPMIYHFYVPDASQSEYITDQATFVKPSGIQSVIALGGQFLSKASFVLIGFTNTPLSEENAKRFASMAPHISTLLAAYDGRGVLWETR